MRRPLLPLAVLLPLLVGADGAAPAKPEVKGSISGKVIAVKDGKPVTQTDVYVYLEPVGRKAKKGALPGKGVRKEIHQKSVNGTQVFEPHVVVIPVGGAVAFPNDDRQEHNVFSPTDPGFDLGRYNTDKKGKSQTFEDADEFDIFCDIHPQMWAKVKVVDSAYIAPVVDGAFTFAGVPPGTYKVIAWTADSAEVKSDKVVVKDAAVTLSDALHLQVTTRSGCHDRKDGTPYDAKYGRYSRCRPQK
jgi:plastocyanin